MESRNMEEIGRGTTCVPVQSLEFLYNHLKQITGFKLRKDDAFNLKLLDLSRSPQLVEAAPIFLDMGGFVDLNLLAGPASLSSQYLSFQACYKWVENSVCLVLDTGKHLEHFRDGQTSLRMCCESPSGLSAAADDAMTVCQLLGPCNL